MIKNLLFIVYDFPPGVLGGSVMRAVKFTKFLLEYGWRPIILTVRRPNILVKDQSIMDDIQGAKIYQCRDIIFPMMKKLYQKYWQKEKISFRPPKLRYYDNIYRSLETWGKILFFNLLGHSAWYLPALFKARSIIKKEKITAILSSSPPHTPHLVALTLSKMFRLPWVADFRDRWADNPIFFERLFKWRHKLNQFWERKVIDSCSYGIIVNERTSNYYKDKYKGSAIFTVWNGYDEDDFKDIIPIQYKKFTISYVGRPGGKKRQFNCFLDALENVNQEVLNNLQILIVGNIMSEIIEKVDKSKLKNKIRFIGLVNHHEAIKFMLSSDVLLIILYKEEDSYYSIAGKIFEYLFAGKIILAICPKNSQLWDLVSSWSLNNICVDIENVDLIKKTIENLYEKWSKEELHIEYKHGRMLQKWNRKEQTRILASILNKSTFKKYNGK